MMKLYKNARGNWACESQFDLTDDLVLIIHTTKRYSGNLITTAQVAKLETNGWTSHAPFSDYNKTIFNESCRATRKAVKDQHEQVFSDMDRWQEIRYNAIHFYNQGVTA
jgi:hypothetical protein